MIDGGVLSKLGINCVNYNYSIFNVLVFRIIN